MSEWKAGRLADLCEGIYDGPHATPRTTRRASDPIFLGISSLDRGRLDLSVTRHLWEEDFVKWTRRVEPRQGDVVFSYETRLGEAAMIPAGLRCCLGRRMGLLRPDRHRVDPHFLLYSYLSPAFQEVLRSRTVQGSTVDRILLSELPDFPMEMPSLDEQREIGGLLSSIDRKIELNVERTATLRAIVSAIYRATFVDFVGAAEMIDTDLGPIPEGWSTRVLGDVAIRLTGTTNPSRAPEDVFEHFSIPAFDAGQRPDVCRGSAILSGKTLLLRNTILVSKLNPSIQRVWDARPSGAGTSVASTEFVALSERDGIPRSFVHSVVRFDTSFWEHLFAHATGTTGSRQRVNPHDVLAAPVVVPPADVLAAYDATVASIFDRIDALARESMTLAELRDTLLPRLFAREIVAVDAPDDALDAREVPVV